MTLWERLKSGRKNYNVMDSCPYCGASLIDDEEDLLAHRVGRRDKKFTLGVIGLVGVIVLVFFLTGNMRKYSVAENLLKLKQYKEAAQVYKGIDNYKDAGEKYQKCRYREAQAVYKEEKYGEAAAIYKEIENYEDSAKWLEESIRQQRTEVRFIKAVRTGLKKRWEYDKDEVDMVNTEFKEYRRTLIHKELDEVVPFEHETFEDEKLKKYAMDYIGTLRDQLRAIEYYGRDQNKCFFDWDRAYDERSILIKKFTEDYGLKVGKKYKDYLGDFIRNAEVSQQLATVKKQVDKMIDVEFEPWEDVGELKEYGFLIKNITDVTFSYFNTNVEYYDENNELKETYGGHSIKNFEPGQEVWSSINIDGELNDPKINVEYSIE